MTSLDMIGFAACAATSVLVLLRAEFIRRRAALAKTRLREGTISSALAAAMSVTWFEMIMLDLTAAVFAWKALDIARGIVIPPSSVAVFSVDSIANTALLIGVVLRDRKAAWALQIIKAATDAHAEDAVVVAQAVSALAEAVPKVIVTAVGETVPPSVDQAIRPFIKTGAISDPSPTPQPGDRP